MSGSLSLQPQLCEECGRQQMLWEVSTAAVGQEQQTNKDTDSRTFNTLFGSRKSTTEETDTETSEESAGNMEQFTLCPDPTCKDYIDKVGDVIFWKMKNASDKNYSDQEINEVSDRKRRQAIRDYRTVTETVEELMKSDTQDTNEDQSVESGQTQIEKETPPQQLDRCECGERQKPTQTSVGTATTEEESVKESNQARKSFKVAVSALPFVEVDVGGGAEDGTETTTKEKESLKTVDTATFPICQDLSCEEHLLMLGRVECWKRRKDSAHEYTSEDINQEVTEILKKEIRGDQILSENAEEVYEDLLGESQDQTQTETMASSTSTQMSAFFRAFDTETASSIGSDGTNTSEQAATEANATSTGAIADRLIETRPSVDGSSGRSNSRGMNNDDEKKGPGGTSL